MVDTRTTLTNVSKTDEDICSCTRRVVEFYCQSEDVLVCKLCKFDLHLTCQTEPIYVLADGIFQSKDYDNTIRELNSLKTAFMTFKTSDVLHTLRRSQERQNAIEDTKRLKIRRNKSSLERELKANILNFQGEMTFERVYDKKDCSKMIANVDYYIDTLEEFKQNGQSKRAFILLFKLKKIIPLIVDILNSLFDKQRHHLINSRIKGTLQRYLTSDNAGNVKLSRSLYNPEFVSPRRISRGSQTIRSSRDTAIDLDMNKSISLHSIDFQKDSVRSIDLNSKTDLRKPSAITRHITTASFDEKDLSGLPTRYLKMRRNGDLEKRISIMKVTKDGRILLLDYHNQRLEMYGLNKLFLNSVELRRPVWDFDFTNEQEILVTCPYDAILLYVQFSDEDVMFEASFIPTQNDCKAICCFSNRIFVTFTGDNPCIKCLSRDGLIYKTINSIENDVLCFLQPLHMHIPPGRSLIFVSDFGLQRVVVLRQNGEIIRSHDVQPGFPSAMTTDRDGNILVSVQGTNKILMISRDGQRSRTLIDRDVVVGQPSALAYKIESKLLLAAFNKESIVKMFHIV